jgi:phosphatidate cytidylyltransferase
MLKQRIITAIILVIVLLATLSAEQSIYWRIFINIAVLIGFWEWLRFCKLTQSGAKICSFAIFICVSALLQIKLVPLNVLVPSVCALWGALFLFTLSEAIEFLHQKIIKLVIGIIVLSSAGLFVIELKELNDGPLWILLFMVCIWAADVGAYFVGKRFGKKKLAPKVSPGKTVEGLLGGVALALLICVPVLFYYFSFKQALLLLLTVVITVLVSVLGDLFESKMKRFAELKDSSQILPGHGGVLDRIDSLLAGAPFFALGLLCLGYLV